MEKRYKVTNVSSKVGLNIPVTISFESSDGAEKTPIYDSRRKIVGYRCIHILNAGESVITINPPPAYEYRLQTEEVSDIEEVKKSSVKRKSKKR